MIRVNQYSMNYLRGWTNFCRSHKLGQNADNGALMIHLAQLIYKSGDIQLADDGDNTSPVQRCIELYYSDFPYDSFTACIRCILGIKHKFPMSRILLIPRGHAWVRDYFISSNGEQDGTDNIGLVNQDGINVAKAALQATSDINSLNSFFNHSSGVFADESFSVTELFFPWLEVQSS